MILSVFYPCSLKACSIQAYDLFHDSASQFVIERTLVDIQVTNLSQNSLDSP